MKGPSSFSIVGGTVSRLVPGSGLPTTIYLAGGKVDFRGGIGFDDKLTLAGGELGGLSVGPGAEVEFVGAQFLLDGQSLEGLLDIGDTIVLSDFAGKTLSGSLRDGRPFSYRLDDANSELYVTRDATVRLTLSEPFLLGDLDFTGQIDVADANPMFTQWGAQVTDNALADLNHDSLVDGADAAMLFALWI